MALFVVKKQELCYNKVSNYSLSTYTFQINILKEKNSYEQDV